MDRNLIDYVPQILKEVKELEALLAAEQPEAELLWDSLDAALENQFVQSAGEYGISRWEKNLAVTPRDSDTLDDRRFRVSARLAAQLPYTERRLRRSLSDLCGPDGYTVAVNGGEYKLTVRIALTSAKNYGDAESMVRRMAPANLIVDISLLYNQYFKLEGFTHGELTAKTHGSIRSESLDA